MSTSTAVPKAGSTFQLANPRTIRRCFVVGLEHGLHARPCALLIKTLKPFRSEVLVEANGEQASGHSILGLMMLAARLGSRITFTMTGEDAPLAMAAVELLFARQFAEAYGRPMDSKTTRSL